jgi:phosphoribosylformylglycinamidine synthase
LFEQDDSLVEVETKVSPAPIQASAKIETPLVYIPVFPG